MSLFSGAKEEVQCNRKDTLIAASNYAEMRITENRQVVIILFIIFKAKQEMLCSKFNTKNLM